MLTQLERCMSIYKHCMDLVAELQIQLCFLEAAIKDEKHEYHVKIKSEIASELDPKDYIDLDAVEKI